MEKRMRAAAKMPDESFKQNEETTSGLVFKRKRKATTPLAEHSHFDGRTPHPGTIHSEGHQDVIVVQECEAGSSKGRACGIQALNSYLL